jgi:hypothetical protein
MPWQARSMRTRLALLVVAALLLPTGCDDDAGGPPAPDETTDAECAARIPDHVFTTLGWTPTEDPAEATLRGCHREAEQGYVEVRVRATSYDKLCATLDRTGTVGPGLPVDWLGADVTACAVEPTADVGQTKVVVRGTGREVTQVTVAVLTGTPQAQVRAAVAELVG